ncbi:MAG: MBL fold metallo-hydrolase [Bacteroidetes bacterium]|nr:MBL fold metallo-hydrolase [Bacteroidota bacterium]
MIVEQLYTGCLSEAAYYIESRGEAAIIDPLRETGPYIRRADKDRARIKYVFETHFHADFVSGHVELAHKTGAKIVYGPMASCGFDCYIAADGEEFKIGDVTIRVLHTPGHTLESSTYLLLDEAGKPYCIFTGDTLFIGDVGRPDLAIKADVTVTDLAGMLYDSLRTRILPLPDDVIVYPAHGAGSACGKNLAKETYDTLGHQKETNYALKAQTKEEFVQAITDGLAPAPRYFPLNAMLNKNGAQSLDEVNKTGLRALSPADFEALAYTGDVLILDTRAPQDFARGFVPGSINIGIDGQFAPWVGALIPTLDQPILLVTDAGREEETVMRLARVGYDGTLGYLSGGVTAWRDSGKDVDQIESISAADFASQHWSDSINVLDIRRPGEYETAHLPHVPNRPLDYIDDWMGTIDKDKKYYIHCAGGYRSMIAASIFRSRGVAQVVNIEGGYGAIAKTELPKEIGAGLVV